MLRILANENVPGDVVAALRQERHDVLWMRTDAPSSSDHQVLERAQAEKRILVTFDKDFGELAYRFKLPASCGIVLFRIVVSSPTYVVRTVVGALKSRADWAGHFSVVEESRIRMTPLPEKREGKI